MLGWHLFCLPQDIWEIGCLPQNPKSKFQLVSRHPKMDCKMACWKIFECAYRRNERDAKTCIFPLPTTDHIQILIPKSVKHIIRLMQKKRKYNLCCFKCTRNRRTCPFRALHLRASLMIFRNSYKIVLAFKNSYRGQYHCWWHNHMVFGCLIDHKTKPNRVIWQLVWLFFSTFTFSFCSTISKFSIDRMSRVLCMGCWSHGSCWCPWT